MYGSRDVLLACLALLAVGCNDGPSGDPVDTSVDDGLAADAVNDTLLEDTAVVPDTPDDPVEEDPTGEEPAGYLCDPPAAAGSLYELEARCLTRHETVSMCEFRGDVLLIANVAALCGYTPQMGDLAALETDYGDQGFEVLGFYCDQFMHQAGDEDQRAACEEYYGVNFLLFDIINVNPPDEHPVFTWIKSQPGGSGAVLWNFEKFLVSRDGELLGRWPTATSPTSTEIRTAIEAALLE